MMGPGVTDGKPYTFTFVVTIGNVIPINQHAENHFCTGALITRQHVLTARHCLAKKNFDDIVVSVGSVDVRGGMKYRAQLWITYNDWYRDMNNRPPVDEYNDLAVIVVKRGLR